MKGNRTICDDKRAGGGENGSMGDVRDKNSGVRGGKGVGIGEACSGNMADSGTISVATSGNSDKDCVANGCDTDAVISEGCGESVG